MKPTRAAASLLRQQRRPTTARLLASTSSTSPSSSLPVLTRSLFTRKTPAQRIKGRIWTATGIVLGGLFAVYAYDSSAGVHRWLFTPLLHAFTKDDPEASHKFAIKVLKSGLSPVDVQDDQDVLAFELWGKRFSNPVGLAAGFDKHAEAIDGLFNLGFSYVEIGSVTPQEQPGNPQPRMFRLPGSQSVINRYGFNSDGHLAVLERLRDRIHSYLVKNARLLPATTFPEQPISANPITDPVQAILANNTDTGVLDNLGLPRSLSNGKVLAINLGKNKLSAPEAVDDYVAGVQTLGPYADVLVVNVSSPNTPGLRSLQKRGIITDLLSQVVAARDGLKGNKPVVLLKIAPDLSRQEVADIGRAAKDTKVDGIIVSNTTISRPASAGNDSALNEAGGLSGPPLKPLSIRTLQTLYALTSGSIPLIGCGGISSGTDALDYAKAGASFVQLYTALGYQGVGLPRMIKDEIAVELQKDNKTWKDIIGSGVDLKSVQQLGRDVNPVNVLGLEGDESGISKLKREIEDVLAGRSPASPVQQVEQELPDWEDSPALNGRVVSSALPSSSHSESGLIPEGYPQIIIVETPPKYAPAPVWTKKDVNEKLEQGKDFVHQVEDKLAGASQAAKDVLTQTKDSAAYVAHDIADDDFARQIKQVTEEITRQTAENFKKLGKDIKDDEFAREIRDTTEAVLKQTKNDFQTLGRKIREEGHFGDAVRGIMNETIERSKQVGRSIRDDGEFGRAVKTFTSDVIRETINRSKALGRAIRDEGHFTEAVQSVVQETIARSKALGHSIKHDGEFSASVKSLTQDVVNETVERSRQLGHDIRDQGEFVDTVKATANEIVQETLARSRQVGRDIQEEGDFSRGFADTIRDATNEALAKAKRVGQAIREQGDFTQATKDTAEGIAHDASVRTQRVADDIKSDSFLHEVKEAFRAATENFKEVGRDIKHDPLVHQQANLDEAKQEAQSIKAGLREGPTGENQRNGAGIFKLFGTFGERANVTSESKRIV